MSDIPVRTKRLILRKITEEDASAMRSILQDAEVMYAWEHAFSEEEFSSWMRIQMERYRDESDAMKGMGMHAVIDRNTEACIGTAGLIPLTHEGKTECEISYLLNKQYWHMGYATEAAKALKDHAIRILGKSRVIASIRTSNLASKGVAERIGMIREKVFIKHYRGKDMPHDLFVSSLGKPEKQS